MCSSPEIFEPPVLSCVSVNQCCNAQALIYSVIGVAGQVIRYWCVAVKRSDTGDFSSMDQLDCEESTN